MAVYERLNMREERVLCHFKAQPVVSERHAIIEDCHGVLYNSSDNMVRDNYRGSSWSKKTGNTRPPLPPPHQGQYYLQRPVDFNVVEAPAQMKQHGVLTAAQAAEKYGGVLITEFRKKLR